MIFIYIQIINEHIYLDICIYRSNRTDFKHANLKLSILYNVVYFNFKLIINKDIYIQVISLLA